MSVALLNLPPPLVWARAVSSAQAVVALGPGTITLCNLANTSIVAVSLGPQGVAAPISFSSPSAPSGLATLAWVSFAYGFKDFDLQVSFAGGGGWFRSVSSNLSPGAPLIVWCSLNGFALADATGQVVQMSFGSLAS